jgi:hypothetical protein
MRHLNLMNCILAYFTIRLIGFKPQRELKAVCIVSLLADGRATGHFVGDIAEFKYYANLLSDVEIDSVKSELVVKYLSRASGGGGNLKRTTRSPPPSIPPSSSSSSSLIAAVVGAVVGLVTVLVVSAVAWLYTSRRRAEVLATRGNIGFQSSDDALEGGSKIVKLVVEIVRHAGLTMLNEDDFVAERTIGQGSHSVVYSARWRTSNTSVAVKVLQIFGVTSDEIADGARAVVTELAVLNAVRHPVVIPVYGVMVTSDEYTPGSVAVRIVMERAECSLQELLMETQSPTSMLSSPDSSFSVRSSDCSDSHTARFRIDLNLRNKLCIAASVASGLAHLHTARVSVVHRDLKPGNILIRRQGDGVSACIADFGVALLDKTDMDLVNPASYRPEGTLMYMVREPRR